MDVVRGHGRARARRGQPGRPQRRAVDLGVPRRSLLALEVPTYRRPDALPALRRRVAKPEKPGSRPIAREPWPKRAAAWPPTASDAAPTTGPTSRAGRRRRARARAARTVQGTLEDGAGAAWPAASRVAVAGAGRTDAGVHALGQVASFDLPRAMPPADLLRALNALLPDDVRVLRRARRRPTGSTRGGAPRSQALPLRARHRTGAAARRAGAWPATCPGRSTRSACPRPPPLFVGRHDFASLASSGGSVTHHRAHRDALGGLASEEARRSSTRSRPTASCARWCAAWWAGWWRRAGARAPVEDLRRRAARPRPPRLAARRPTPAGSRWCASTTRRRRRADKIGLRQPHVPAGPARRRSLGLRGAARSCAPSTSTACPATWP